MRGPIQGVGAGTRDDVDLSAGIAAECGVVGVGEHFELADGVDGRANGDGVQFWIDVVHAVE